MIKGGGKEHWESTRKAISSQAPMTQRECCFFSFGASRRSAGGRGQGTWTAASTGKRSACYSALPFPVQYVQVNNSLPTAPPLTVTACPTSCTRHVCRGLFARLCNSFAVVNGTGTTMPRCLVRLHTPSGTGTGNLKMPRDVPFLNLDASRQGASQKVAHARACALLGDLGG